MPGYWKGSEINAVTLSLLVVNIWDHIKPLIYCLTLKRHSAQGQLLLSALLLNKRVISIPLQAQNMQDIRLELEDVGWGHRFHETGSTPRAVLRWHQSPDVSLPWQGRITVKGSAVLWFRGWKSFRSSLHSSVWGTPTAGLLPSRRRKHPVINQPEGPGRGLWNWEQRGWER